jgi:hypothetical protein
MESVSIRNLRGESLRESADEGKLLAITNRGALIGVVIPVAAAWLEHLIVHNLSQVQQSIAEAEQAIAAATPMTTIQDVIGQLHEMLNPAPPAGRTMRAVRTVRIGDLTAKLIEKAGTDGQTLALTHDRQLIAMVVPVTRDLVTFLLEQNMSRVLHNINLAEKQMKTKDPLISVDRPVADPLALPGPRG